MPNEPMNFMEEELERRKSRVGGYTRLQKFAMDTKARIPVVAGKIQSASKKAGAGFIDSAKSLNKAHDSFQNWRIKKMEKQRQLAVVKSKRDKARMQGGSMNPFMMSSNNNPVVMDDRYAPKKKKSSKIIINLNR